MQKTKKQISIATALACSVLSFNLQAQTCVDAPDCKTLGYKFTQKECEGMGSVKCPYDDSYYFCIQGSTDAYDSNIGDILYDDFTTSPNIITTKKPIGVVFTTGRDINYAIALQNAKDNGTKTLYSYNYLAKVPNYTTQGTILGDWELPDTSLMQLAYYNKDKLNEALNRVGGTVLSGSYKTKTGSISMIDGATSTESGISLRGVIKLNPPAGKSYAYTLENCSGAVDGDIYHGKFEKCRTTPMVGDYLTADKKMISHVGFVEENFKSLVALVVDSENRKAVALPTEISSEFIWGYDDEGIMVDYTIGGKEATRRWVEKGIKENTAVWFVVNYQPDVGEVKDWFAAGKWYIPSRTEFYEFSNNYFKLGQVWRQIGEGTNRFIEDGPDGFMSDQQCTTDDGEDGMITRDLPFINNGYSSGEYCISMTADAVAWPFVDF